MKTETITAAVDRGLEILEQAAQHAREMEEILGLLERAALEGEQVPLADDAREGMQYLAQGTRAVVPVVITADLIAQSFTEGSVAHGRIEATARGKLARFFKRTVTWKLLARDGKAFREEARAVLGRQAPSFISACLARDKTGVPKNLIKVHWDRAEENAGAERTP